MEGHRLCLCSFSISIKHLIEKVEVVIGGAFQLSCSFGQEKKKTELVSPNIVLIRTGEEENRVGESELSAYSDRRRRKPSW